MSSSHHSKNILTNDATAPLDQTPTEEETPEIFSSLFYFFNGCHYESWKYFSWESFLEHSVLQIGMATQKHVISAGIKW